MNYTRIKLKKKTKEELIRIILLFQKINQTPKQTDQIVDVKSYTVVADGTKGMQRG